MKKLGILAAGVLLTACNGGSGTASSTLANSSAKSPATTGKISLKSSPIDPNAKAGYLPVEIVDNTKVNQDIYILAKAGIPISDAPDSEVEDCVMEFDSNGIGKCNKVNKDTDIMKYARVKLKDLHHDSAGNILVYIPHVSSGRMFFSVARPLDFTLVTSKDKDGHDSYIRIVDPNPADRTNPSYYTIFDKIEYSFNNNGVWDNPTAVDYFSMPLLMEESDSQSEFKRVGISEPREQVFNQLQELVNSKDKTPTHEWGKLFLRYADFSGNQSILRFMSPSKMMVSGTQEEEKSFNFDKNYLSNPSTYGFSYIDSLWAYYSLPGHELTIDCTEINGKTHLDSYIFKGHVNAQNEFIFSNGHGNQVVINKPGDRGSRVYFGGAGIINADGSAGGAYTPDSIIEREITSAFDAGLLPVPEGTILNKNYFVTHHSDFYIDNPLLNAGQTGPWYDLYSKALHSFGVPIYTFAYDDALGQDGTMHDPNGVNPGTVKITLGSLAGTHIPNPFVDPNHYKVTVNVGSGTNLIDMASGRTLKNGDVLTDVSVPFKVKYNDKELNLYFNPSLVTPSSFEFAGIIVKKAKDKNEATIDFPGSSAAPDPSNFDNDDHNLYKLHFILGQTTTGVTKELKYNSNVITNNTGNFNEVKSPIEIKVDNQEFKVYLKDKAAGTLPGNGGIVVDTSNPELVQVIIPGPAS
ncbi:beta-1,3-glucanase family protein [Aquella oligotrophica]|uniref:GH64 domain-containing protein n=1 Tax=Aquella oligotrophica TaxID=2067065 RepID=A0A2I7N8H5_9NEIS|nr:beta-1,3-glucanase family protein [Aquella oligotrophica]AUR52535.1 hypothetical protein CUN60_09570 [Aquella oligotrophica]